MIKQYNGRPQVTWKEEVTNEFVGVRVRLRLGRMLWWKCVFYKAQG